MRRYCIAICLGQAATLGTALVLAVSISTALDTNNASSTRKLIVAQYQLTRLLAANLTSGLASMDALVERVRRECPGVGSEAPPSALGQAQKFVQEMGGILVVTLLHSSRHAIIRFVRLVAPLHWRTSKLTNMVKAEVSKLDELDNITIPDLCMNVRAWATSHFAVLPIATLQFDQGLTASESGLRRPVIKIIQPYEDPRTRALARRVHILQKRFELRESKHSLRYSFALVRAIFGSKCTSGRLCLPFQVLTPGDLERGQLSN